MQEMAGRVMFWLPSGTKKQKRNMKKSIRAALAASALGAAVASQGGVIVLDFEGLQNNEPILNYYNGGFGGLGSGPGPDYDLTWSADSLAIIDADAGGSGNIGGEPSPDTALYFLTASAILDVPNGFTTGFSLYYTAINYTGVITVWDGPNATGNILATLNLPLTPDTGAPDPSGNFSPFLPAGVAFAGTAYSIDFGGTGNQIAYDNITFGSEVPHPAVPEPSTIFGGLALAGLALTRLRKR